MSVPHNTHVTIHSMYVILSTMMSFNHASLSCTASSIDSCQTFPHLIFSQSSFTTSLNKNTLSPNISTCHSILPPSYPKVSLSSVMHSITTSPSRRSTISLSLWCTVLPRWIRKSPIPEQDRETKDSYLRIRICSLAESHT